MLRSSLTVPRPWSWVSLSLLTLHGLFKKESARDTSRVICVAHCSTPESKRETDRCKADGSACGQSSHKFHLQNLHGHWQPPQLPTTQQTLNHKITDSMPPTGVFLQALGRLIHTFHDHTSSLHVDFTLLFALSAFCLPQQIQRCPLLLSSG